MAKIAILMLPQSSHIQAGMRVSHILEDAGHQVVNLCTLQDQDNFERNRCQTRLIAQKSLSQALAKLVDAPSIFRRIGNIRRTVSNAVEEIADDLETMIAEENPDLFIIDTMCAPAAFVPMQKSRPIVLLNTMLPTTWDPPILPLSHGSPPPQSLWGRLRSYWVWQRLLIVKSLIDRISGMRKATVNLAKRCGIDPSIMNQRQQFGINLPLPHLVLSPEEMDFPRPSDHHRRYMGPCLDPNRAEVDFPWDRLDEEKPLIYCAMSSQGTFRSRGEARAFFQTVVDTIGAQPNRQLVVSTHGCLKKDDVENPYDNVIVVQKAPQMSLLEKAHLAVTHGGLNSVKECLYQGVPMILFPGHHDQPGNAARVAFHGLGVIAHPKGLTQDSLGILVDQILNDANVQHKVTNMQAIFRRENEAEHFTSLLDEMLQNAPLLNEG